MTRGQRKDKRNWQRKDKEIDNRIDNGINKEVKEIGKSKISHNTITKMNKTENKRTLLDRE